MADVESLARELHESGGGSEELILALLRDLEVTAMCRALHWAAEHPRLAQDYYWPNSSLHELASAVAAGEEKVP